MPRPLSPEPLYRTDLLLFEADVTYLKAQIGVGWTTYIRELVRRDVHSQQKQKRPHRRTIGDLIDE